MSGKGFKFEFTECDNPKISAEKLKSEYGVDKLHIYVHIPFCRHTCPYCPYNKVEWNESQAREYYAAVETEITKYGQVLCDIEVPSIYFGGGSPAIAPQKIPSILNSIKKFFKLCGGVFLEINPAECDHITLRALRESNVHGVSIGVQSFQDEKLHFIGRGYTAKEAIEALKRVLGYFQNVNVDLMFALPNQRLKDLENDLRIATSLEVPQITVYPLFTFPYSTVGRYRKLKRVKMPNITLRRRQYYFIHDFLTSHNYEPVSVWSFMRKTSDSVNAKYSSVTREYYIGFGAGAGSYYPWGFYLNTFPVNSYIRRIKTDRLPIALEFAFDERMDNLFWLYWRFYETKIPLHHFEERFGEDPKVKSLIKIFESMGFMERNDAYIRLNKRGSFWLHLAQNYFALNYVSKIWSVALNEPFPKRIEF